MTSTLDLARDGDLAPDAPQAVPLETVELEVVECTDPQAVLERLVAALRTHPEQLVVDLEGCHSFHADTVRVLLDAHCEAARDGAVLVLRRPSEPVRRAIADSGLQGVFRVEDGPAGAQGERSAA